jgi:hypothetical protein
VDRGAPGEGEFSKRTSRKSIDPLTGGPTPPSSEGEGMKTQAGARETFPRMSKP